ncbi:peptidoglycan-binding domain-containing protein [Methylobacterium symbioticum]|uniref:Peptidoglycan binding-like domain-containing protein n=1 Tax=Methylobacterium symbioticum TaxID=2584084 RepID=A0A509EBR7_9HYPH|nr:peptidoglycan-binding domain-containing protein [Methylobacterium symbioticum]VUD70593.1 hypothetical protein MET9862_01163 [Methylobacterium symbioticum]
MADYREISVAGEDRGARKPAQRRSAPPRRAAAVQAVDWRGLGLGLARYGRARPATVLGALAALGAVVVVCLNALGSQSGRHPAPILPKVAVRQDAPREAKVPPVEKLADEARAAPRTPDRPQEAAAKPTRDPIAALIRQEETTASVTPKADRPEKTDKGDKADKSVLQAQRALNKLGYGPLKADGLIGPGTRAAIEKFERDRKLPVKGEAAGRTLKELAARAG